MALVLSQRVGDCVILQVRCLNSMFTLWPDLRAVNWLCTYCKVLLDCLVLCDGVRYGGGRCWGQETLIPTAICPGVTLQASWKAQEAVWPSQGKSSGYEATEARYQGKEVFSCFYIIASLILLKISYSVFWSYPFLFCPEPPPRQFYFDSWFQRENSIMMGQAWLL